MPQASHADQSYNTGPYGSSTFDVSRPAAAATAGKLVLVFMCQDLGSPNELTLSTGSGAAWNVGITGTAGGNSKVLWKFTNASEPSVWTGGHNEGADCAATVVVINDADPAHTPNFQITNAAASGSTVSTPGVTPFGADDIEYRCAIGYTEGTSRTWTSYASTSPSLTLLTNVEQGGFVTQRVAYRQLNSASATSAVTATGSGTMSGGRQGITVAVKSASAPATEANLGLAQEQNIAYAMTTELGLNATLGVAREANVANPIDGWVTMPLEVNLGLAIEQHRALPMTHRGGQPPPPPPPPPPRDTRDPRMPLVQAEVGFITDASIQGYLVLDDPERGRLDQGKLAPGGGPSIGGEIFEDITPYLSAVSTVQGASRVDGPLVRYDSGTAVLTLRNEDRRFDPTNLDGPYVTGSGSSDTEAETFICTKGLRRAFAVTIGVRSHSSNGPARLRAFTAKQHYGSSTSLDKPPDTAEGDYLIAINLSDWGSSGSVGTPTGGAAWGSPLVSESYGTNRGHLKIWGKYAGASEPSTYGFTKSSSADSVLAVIAIQGVAASSVPVVEIDLVTNTAIIDTPGITPHEPNDIEIRFAGGVADGGELASWDAPQGFSEIVDLDSNGYATGSVGVRQLNAVGEGESQVVPMRPVRIMATWGSTTNMVPNPSFEEGSLESWTGDSSTISASTQHSIYGRWSLEVKKLSDNPLHVLSANTGWSQGTAADGDVVTASFWVYVPSAAYDNLDSFFMRGFDENGQESMPIGFVGKPRQADRWERIWGTGVVAQGKVVYGLTVQAWTNGNHPIGDTIFFMDGVQMVKGGQPEPFTNNMRRFPLWQGFIDEWTVNWDVQKGPNWSEVEVTASDAFKVFENVDRLPSAPQGAGEDTGARINRILDTVFWPTDLRQVAVGDSTLQETTLEGTVLNELMHVVDSELGEGYMDSSGRFVFRNRNAVLTEPRSTEPQAVFGDNYENPQELPWEELGVSTDDAQLLNKVSIGRAGGEVQVVEDAASQGKYLLRTFNREDLLFETDGEALGYANWILELNRRPELRFDSMTINVLKDPWRLFPQVLERQIGDRIRIIRRPPGGGDPIIRDVLIRGIRHEIGQVHWKTTWTFQAADKYSSVVPF